MSDQAICAPSPSCGDTNHDDVNPGPSTAASPLFTRCTQSASTASGEASSSLQHPGGSAALGAGGHRQSKGFSVQIKEPPVSETRGYDVTKSEQKHGPLYNAIPLMPLPVAVICCVLNIVLPGTGI